MRSRNIFGASDLKKPHDLYFEHMQKQAVLGAVVGGVARAVGSLATRAGGFLKSTVQSLPKPVPPKAPTVPPVNAASRPQGLRVAKSLQENNSLLPKNINTSGPIKVTQPQQKPTSSIPQVKNQATVKTVAAQEQGQKMSPMELFDKAQTAMQVASYIPSGHRGQQQRLDPNSMLGDRQGQIGYRA